MAQEITYTDNIADQKKEIVELYTQASEENRFVIHLLLEAASKNSKQWKQLCKMHQPTRKEILSILSLK